jgi:hypothetical protein
MQLEPNLDWDCKTVPAKVWATAETLTVKSRIAITGTSLNKWGFGNGMKKKT